MKKNTLILSNFVRDQISTSFIFCIEWTFADLLHAIDDSKYNSKTLRGFDLIVKGVLLETGFDESGYEYDVFRALASIRNSFHNNGLHTNASFEVEIEGKRFNFIKGSPVACANFFDVLHLINFSIKIIEKIFLSDKITLIKSLPENLFASLVDPAF